MPLALAVAAQGADTEPPGRLPSRLAWLPSGSGAVGASFGITHQLLLLSWVPATVSLTHSSLGIPFYLALVATIALLEAVAVMAMVGAVRTLAVPLPLAVAIPWVAMEWVRAHLGGFSFPWSGLALGLTGFPAAVGLAEWVGERGVAFWIALSAGCFALAIPTNRNRKGRVRWLLGATALVLVPIGGGWWRTAGLEVEEVARVAILQPSLTTLTRGDSAVSLDSTLVRFRRLAGALEPRVDLLVGPEASVPRVLDREPALIAGLAELAGGTPWILGAFSEDSSGGRYNAAWAIERGRVDHRPWMKTRLVPGWERTPGIGGGLLDSAGIRQGDYAGPLRAAGVDWGVLICFESLFGGLARRHVKQGAEALLSLTNDAWFVEAGPQGRVAAEQHLAHLILRAAETRKGVARAANSGVSAIIAPTGVIQQRLGAGVQGAITGSLWSVPGNTLYVRTGDWAGGLCALLAALGLFRVGWLQRRGAR